MIYLSKSMTRGLFVTLCFSGMALLVGTAGAQDENPGRGKSEATIAGKKITLDYGRPSTDGNGFKMMASGIKDGLIWRMGSNARNSIDSEANLKFGDDVIKAGAYSLWAKRVDGAWHLLFHPDAKGWGMPAPKDGYLDVKIPLKAKALDENVKWLTLEVKKDDKDENGGIIRLSWGKEEGSAKFTVVD